ncbi:MAG: indole-3-glycerol phosphate synthase [Bacteroidia bacterium]|nr:MAG: indole-3-glycerol phosphate synthase [Bacteroidia bacterium]
MNLLEKIVAEKRKEIEEKKSLYPVKWLEKSNYFPTECVSLKKYLQKFENQFSIIAEFKRKSPSKGIINEYAKVEEITLGYMQAGACALSILTDEKYFGAKPDDLSTARYWHYCPILRKDFILDEYQILEAKAMGADVILLIVRILDFDSLQRLCQFAKSLGLEVLMEFHDIKDIQKCQDCIDYDIAGINHRNLDTLEFHYQNSIELLEKLPKEKLRIAESGINSPEILVNLKKLGYQGFLIGEYFMKSYNPGNACKNFIQEAQELWQRS